METKSVQVAVREEEVSPGLDFRLTTRTICILYYNLRDDADELPVFSRGWISFRFASRSVPFAATTYSYSKQKTEQILLKLVPIAAVLSETRESSEIFVCSR